MMLAVNAFFSFATAITLWWLLFPKSFGEHLAKVAKGMGQPK